MFENVDIHTTRTHIWMRLTYPISSPLSLQLRWAKNELLQLKSWKNGCKLMSLISRKPSWFVTRVDSKRPAQPQKLGRGLKFRIWKPEVLYYLGSRQQTTKALICAFVVRIWRNRFSHDVAQIILIDKSC